MPESKCRQCNETFSSLSGFDAHQTQRGDRVTCKDPSAKGMVRDEAKARWKYPDESFTFAATKDGAPPAWTGTCASCHQVMTKKPGRGRPPKTCQDCGGKGFPVKTQR